MKIQLPQPITSNIAYEAVIAEHTMPDEVNQVWTATLFGVCNGHTVPLTIVTADGTLHRIEAITIPYAKIAAVGEAYGVPAGMVSLDIVAAAGMQVLTEMLAPPAPVEPGA